MGKIMDKFKQMGKNFKYNAKINKESGKVSKDTIGQQTRAYKIARSKGHSPLESFKAMEDIHRLSRTGGPLSAEGLAKIRKRQKARYAKEKK